MSDISHKSSRYEPSFSSDIDEYIESMCGIIRSSGDEHSEVIERHLRKTGEKLVWHVSGSFRQSEGGMPEVSALDIQSIMFLQKTCKRDYPIVLGTALAGVAQPGRPVVSSAICWAILCYESHLINILNGQRKFLFHLPIKLKPQ